MTAFEETGDADARVRVDADSPAELAFWAVVLDVTTHELRNAAEHAGTDVYSVSRYLVSRPYVSWSLH
jgi:Protein of unknown function (DUF3606)